MARVRGPGHPDVACDLIAASVVQEYLRRDPSSRLNVRVNGGRGVLFIAGDVQSSADFDVSAVVRRALAGVGVSASFEPFIAFEPMNPGWTQSVVGREPVAATGYATAETADHVPLTLQMAREGARELERRRTADADWFWLGSDVEVTVQQGATPLVIVRAEHLDTVDAKGVREQVATVLADRFSQASFPTPTIRVNIGGEETAAGLSHRIGGSGSISSFDAHGLGLPMSGSGVGRQATHPLNAGAWMARACARELVRAGKGRAVSVQLAWLPLETRPYYLRARNERGENLAPLLDAERFDLARLPETYLQPSVVVDALRLGFDAGLFLPWETG